MLGEDKVRKDPVGFCPHCCNMAPQEIVSTVDAVEEEVGETLTYVIAQCQTCGHILLYVTIGDRTTFDPQLLGEQRPVWPNAELGLGIPTVVRQRYEEAQRIKHIAPNAFAGQIRSCLEALCHDRGATKGSLVKNLEELATRGEIPPLLAQMSEVIRVLGNVGVHGLGDIGPRDVCAIDEFFKALVEYVYEAPWRLRMFQSRLRELKEK